MRFIPVAAAVTALAALSGCGANAVHQTEALAPTVTYGYSRDGDYAVIYDKADEYCDDEYDRNAVLVARESTTGGYEATFECR